MGACRGWGRMTMFCVVFLMTLPGVRTSIEHSHTNWEKPCLPHFYREGASHLKPFTGAARLRLTTSYVHRVTTFGTETSPYPFQ